MGHGRTEEFRKDAVRIALTSGLTRKLVISDAHSDLRAAHERVFEGGGVKRLIRWINRSPNRQHGGVHWIRNALAHVSRGQHTVVAAAIQQAFDQPDRKHAGEAWRHVAEQLRARWSKLAGLINESKHDVLVYMGFPRQHRTKLHSTNLIEDLNKEVKRRADVGGFFPTSRPLPV